MERLVGEAMIFFWINEMKPFVLDEEEVSEGKYIVGYVREVWVDVLGSDLSKTSGILLGYIQTAS